MARCRSEGNKSARFYTELNEISALGFESYSANTDIFNMSYGLDTVSSSLLLGTTEDALWYGVANLRNGKGGIYIQSAGNGFQSYPITARSTGVLFRCRRERP